ncbi:MAG: hypothetical protein OXI46_11415 [Gemmatimonadota bacterium]|nr:hypothetical protein [Gemmatimonadota bacterium]
MKHFESADEYITALRKKPRKYAIIPKSLAGKALGLSRAGITKQVETGKLAEVGVSGRRYLLARGVANSLENERRLTERIRKILEDLAGDGRTITYGKLMGSVEMSSQRPPDRDKIGKILGRISKATHDESRIMLSVLVVRKHDSLPSPPFFSLAKKLGFRWSSDSRFVEKHTELVWSKYQ